MTEPEPIITTNLRLEPLHPETFEAMLKDDRRAAERAQVMQLPDEFVESLEPRFLEIQLKHMRVRPSRRGWCARAIVRKDDGAIIGHCGFHGPPEEVGRAEIGYTVARDYQGRGYATEAARGLVEWAKSQGERAVYASVSPDNAASLAVVNKVGFRRIGVKVDEIDGEEIVFELRL